MPNLRTFRETSVCFDVTPLRRASVWCFSARELGLVVASWVEAFPAVEMRLTPHEVVVFFRLPEGVVVDLEVLERRVEEHRRSVNALVERDRVDVSKSGVASKIVETLKVEPLSNTEEVREK